jgi:beta-lactam-binding protein with PASTA domain
MKALLKYPLIFAFCFVIAGGTVFYAIKLFTQSAQEVVVPELAGKNIIYVLETLTRLGLNAQLYGSRYDDIIPKYAVLSQDPVPGTTIKKGRDVIIYISKGRKLNVVPDLRSLDLAAALIALEKNEFSAGHISRTYSAASEKGRILAQHPTPFRTALKDTACNLLVSKGPAPLRKMMPNLAALQLTQAAAKIEQANLTLYHIQAGQHPEKNSGIVLSQQPPAGAPVSSGTPISLVVNHFGREKIMNPKHLQQIRLFSFQLGPGFLKSHVRVETDYFGPIIDLYNEYAVPGQEIAIFIPLEKRTDLRFYVDGRLTNIITVDPWKEDIDTGEIAWELLPLQFYQPTLPY